MSERVAQVYAAISAVTAAFSESGLAKSRKNQQQGYMFRGIDDIYNTLSPLLVEHKLLILPRVEERTVMERASRQGGSLIHVTVKMAFDLVSVEDGSIVQVSSFGEAMDSGDKATNKALSTAYRYMAMQVFCIPTIGTDPEEDTPEIASDEGVARAFLASAEQRASEGELAFRSWYMGLSDANRLVLRPQMDRLKAKAASSSPHRPGEGMGD